MATALLLDLLLRVIAVGVVRLGVVMPLAAEVAMMAAEWVEEWCV
jgi:hypothetical protein